MCLTSVFIPYVHPARHRSSNSDDSQSSSRIGRNVTLDVICFIISLISPWTSFSVFWCFFDDLAPPGNGVFWFGFGLEGSSAWISNCHRSSVSSVSTDFIARTRRLMDDDNSHSVHEQKSHMKCRAAELSRRSQLPNGSSLSAEDPSTHLAPVRESSRGTLSSSHRQ
jgi:hypothetical protein